MTPFENLYIQFASNDGGHATIRKWPQFPFAGGVEYALAVADTPAAVTHVARSWPRLGLMTSHDTARDCSPSPSVEPSEVGAVVGLNVVPENPGKNGSPQNTYDQHRFSNIHGVSPLPPTNLASFQARVQPWMVTCFGERIAGDREERNHRFLEEALELVKSTSCTESEAHQLVDYVYGRPMGEPHQEVGGVMVTLAALCLANALDLHQTGETELARVWTKVEQIRAKQAGKPKHSATPVHTEKLVSPNDSFHPPPQTKMRGSE